MIEKHISNQRDVLIWKTLKLDEISEEHTKVDVMMQNHAWMNFDAQRKSVWVIKDEFLIKNLSLKKTLN